MQLFRAQTQNYRLDGSVCYKVPRACSVTALGQSPRLPAQKLHQGLKPESPGPIRGYKEHLGLVLPDFLREQDKQREGKRRSAAQFFTLGGCSACSERRREHQLLLTGGAGCGKRSRSNSANTIPWWETAAQSSISSESTHHLEQRLFFLRGGGEVEEDEEDREDSFLHGLFSQLRRLLFLGTEPCGEDAVISLPEDDGEERCAGVRDAE
ncbi:UNVERIFIED_CONTAM: hypothetical protein FKN15_000983 [Acipenser sinensis]